LKCFYSIDFIFIDILGCAGIHLAAQFSHSSIVAYLISKGVVSHFGISIFIILVELSKRWS